MNRDWYRKLPRDYQRIAWSIFQSWGDGPITVARIIGVADESQIRWNNIGSCWADNVDGASIYASGPNSAHGDLRIRLLGEVSQADVDWDATVSQRKAYPHEFEIRLKPGTVVSVFAVEHWQPYHRVFIGDELNPPRLARVGPDDYGMWVNEP